MIMGTAPQSASGAITPITLMPARPMVITDLIGSSAACLSAPAHGMAGAVAVGATVDGAATDIGAAMVTVAVTDIAVGTDIAADTRVTDLSAVTATPAAHVDLLPVQVAVVMHSTAAEPSTPVAAWADSTAAEAEAFMVEAADTAKFNRS